MLTRRCLCQPVLKMLLGTKPPPSVVVAIKSPSPLLIVFPQHWPSLMQAAVIYLPASIHSIHCCPTSITSTPSPLPLYSAMPPRLLAGSPAMKNQMRKVMTSTLPMAALTPPMLAARPATGSTLNQSKGCYDESIQLYWHSWSSGTCLSIHGPYHTHRSFRYTHCLLQ